MVNRRNRDIRSILRNIAPNMRLFYMEEQNQFVLSLYIYIENVYTYDFPVEELAHIVGEEISPKAQEDIMTIAEKLRKEGELKGELKAKIETAKSMLADGIEPAFIAKYTKLPIAQIKALQ